MLKNLWGYFYLACHPVWTELSEAERRLDSSQQSDHIQMFYPPPENTEVSLWTLFKRSTLDLLSVNLLSFWVIFSPDSLKLVKVMGSQNWPITRQVVKVVHDDSHKQVDDLRKHMNQSVTVPDINICKIKIKKKWNEMFSFPLKSSLFNLLYWPERHKACRSWRSKWWRIGCRSPRWLCCFRWSSPSHTADWVNMPAWSPATLHLSHI